MDLTNRAASVVLKNINLSSLQGQGVASTHIRKNPASNQRATRFRTEKAFHKASAAADRWLLAWKLMSLPAEGPGIVGWFHSLRD